MNKKLGNTALLVGGSGSKGQWGYGAVGVGGSGTMGVGGSGIHELSL